MYSIDVVNDMLDDVASELPDDLFRDLNGGVCLLAEAKRSDADPDGRLFTLGEYRRDQMGRYIVIYYGSICAVHGDNTYEELKNNLRKLLRHELTHHLESLSGERSLEVKDAVELQRFLESG